MKKLILSFLCITTMLVSYGQKHGKDNLYLKNGTILKGILVHRDLETVKFQSAGNLFVYKLNEIDSISKTKFRNDSYSCKTDYYFDSSIGVIAGGSGNGKEAPFVFNTSFNYLTWKNLYTGAGMGVEFWDESYLPVFLNINYLFRETRFSPFINFQGGYLVSLGDVEPNQVYYYYDSTIAPYNKITEANGGILINPSFGFRSMSNPNFGWTFSFGFRYHQLKYKGENGYSNEHNFNRLTLRIGITFN